MNPAMLLRIKQAARDFRERHPKLPKFFEYVSRNHLREGAVLEIIVRLPDGDDVKTNLRLTREDVMLLEDLRQLLDEQSR